MALLAVAAISCATRGPDAPAEFDLLLAGGTVVDGTGAAGFPGDVAIADGRIAAVGSGIDRGRARRVIDVDGLVVAPGFIDNHAHLVDLEEHPLAENFLRQGITTIFSTLHSHDQPWPIDAYTERVTMAPNVGLFAGHTWTRKRVLGLADRAPSATELEEMERLVEASMQQGALGLSTGLEYVPATFAELDEIIALARIAAHYGGVYATHMRDEGPALLQSVEDALRVGREAGLPVLINHHKATGAAQFGWSARSLALIDAATSDGCPVAHDLYPYTAFSTLSDVLFPAWALADGSEAFARRTDDPATRRRIVDEMMRIFPQQAGDGPRSIQFREVASQPDLAGRTLADYLTRQGRATTIAESVEAVVELQRAGGFIAVFHAMHEDDVQRIMRHPLAMFDTDGDLVTPGEGFPHPRSYGAFPRVLARYVRELGVLTLEEAIAKMTSLPARWWGQADLGVVEPTRRADLVVFDANTIADRATFTDPHRYATGVVHVLVNGVAVIEAGEVTGAKPGRFLQRPRR